jgi:hypothetical protein
LKYPAGTEKEVSINKNHGHELWSLCMQWALKSRKILMGKRIIKKIPGFSHGFRIA